MLSVPSGKFFYGWWVVAAAIVGQSTGPAQFAFAALGLFMLPFAHEFGWQRAEVSLALTFFTVVLALSLPVVGGIVDRVGSRKVLLPSIAAVGLLLAAIPLLVTQLWHLYAIFVLIGSLGAGANSLPYMRTISAWFNRRRGLAIGLSMAGAGLGYGYVPPLVQYFIGTYGWRSGYFVLAAITLAIAIPVVYALLRESPQAMGLEPDGGEVMPAQHKSPETGLDRAQALRRPEFWLLFIVFAVLSFTFYGLLPHLVPMLTDRGMSGTQSALVASTIGWTILVARVLIGVLIDRFFAPRVAMAFFMLSALGMAVLALGGVGGAAYLAAILIGFSIGAEIDLMAYMAGRYFGLRSFGQIYGLLFAALLVGTSLGPVAFGQTFDRTGSYVPILGVCSVLIIFAVIVTAFLPPYTKLSTT